MGDLGHEFPPRGACLQPRLTPGNAFVQGFETEFRAAPEPIWKDALATVPLKMTLSKPPTPQGFSGIQWIKVANEILSRVEEAVYMNLRQGKGASLAAPTCRPWRRAGS